MYIQLKYTVYNETQDIKLKSTTKHSNTKCREYLCENKSKLTVINTHTHHLGIGID